MWKYILPAVTLAYIGQYVFRSLGSATLPGEVNGLNAHTVPPAAT